MKTYILVRTGQFADTGGSYCHQIYKLQRNGTYALLSRDNGDSAEFEEGPLVDNHPVSAFDGGTRIAALTAWEAA